MKKQGTVQTKRSEEDLEDIEYLIRVEGLKADAVRQAMQQALVPPLFLADYPAACERVEKLLTRQ